MLMDTGSFIVYIKLEESDRSLPKGKNEKVTGLMKDELIGKNAVLQRTTMKIEKGNKEKIKNS